MLSDPQERAWYDSHQDVLFGGNGEGSEAHFQRNVRVTTAEDISKMCLNRHAFSDFSDSPSGFFTTVRDVFDRLALEESIACEMEDRAARTYPTFGTAGDKYEDGLKHFYSIWSNFATQKNFAWKDAYRYSEAPDRRTRRIMEKENKRLRDEGIREFNDAVRTMVGFVRKRDPRYTPNSQTEAERHSSMRAKAAAQAAQARAANQAKLADVAVPDWAKSESVDEPEMKEWPSEDEPEEHFECIICKKVFKSENQYEVHEKSKKHVKTVQQLKRKMQRENLALGLDDREKVSASNPEPEQVNDEAILAESVEQHPNVDREDLAKDADRVTTATPVEHTGPVSASDGTESLATDTDEEYAPRSRVEERISDAKESRLESEADDAEPGEPGEPPKTEYWPATKDKVGKAKARRARKAAKQADENSARDIKCATCQATFPSKTKLFNHITELGHAKAVEKTPKSGKKGQRR